MQALAFVPTQDVIKGFELLKQSAPKTFAHMLDYLEANYIGKFKKNSITTRSDARFPISTWNLHERIKRDLPRTNNNVEAWHSRINQDTKKNLTVNKTIEIFRKEQSLMENNYARLINGEILFKQTIKQKEKDSNIKRLVQSYRVGELEIFFTGIGNNLHEQKVS